MSTFYFVNGCGTEYTKPSKMGNSEKHAGTKRPPNSFILYRKDRQKSGLISTMNLHSKDISKEAALMWKNEPEEVKLKYQRMAEEEKDKHFRKYPGYKYNPQLKKKNQATDGSSRKSKTNKKIKETLNNNKIEPVIEKQLQQQNVQKEVDECIFSEDLFDHLVSFPPPTLPSSVVEISQLFPDGPNLDSMSVKNYELFTIMSLIQST